MSLFKQTVFASALTLASAIGIAPGDAHEIKLGNIVIHHPWSRQSPRAADVAAGYMTIANTGKEDDRLVRATSEISASAQIHDMRMAGDVMRMEELPDGIVIPAGATVKLRPKGLHIMFTGLRQQVMEGEEFSGTLTFEKAGTVSVNYEVAAPGGDMSDMH
ncbi:copper chaperone PCu(A)C [Aestuariivirga sp.]|uniref:copper chaperone PCu(A)C n=1 Tax=Aestuariivirga sp. TaxID=2650926 RepID=UPI0025C177AC|nr:copper chaperone PCu(A)C [Aestuariivirga sp.]MCA3554771.1 copper chaperone PCu(A)C [Aestuariivirga sp.]